MEKIGITKISNALLSAGNLVKSIDTSLSDSNITPIEYAKIGFAGLNFAKNVVGFKELKAEFLDLDAEEKAQIINEFATCFDLINDEAEAVVEQIFEGLITLSGAFTRK